MSGVHGENGATGLGGGGGLGGGCSGQPPQSGTHAHAPAQHRLSSAAFATIRSTSSLHGQVLARRAPAAQPE